MKKITAMLLAVVLLLGLAACAQPVQTSTGTFEGEGYVFDPPEGWVMETRDGAQQFISPEEGNNNNITINILDERDPDIENYSEETLTNLYSTILQNFEAVSFEVLDVSGYVAYYFEYVFTYDGNAMKQYQLIVDSYPSTISFTFNQVQGDISDIVQSCISSLTVYGAEAVTGAE